MKPGSRPADRLSICQLCLPSTTFEEDVDLALRHGFRGLSIDENKLRGASDASLLARFPGSGLRAVACAASVWSILPVRSFREPFEPEARVDLICAGVRRLAAFDPVTVFVATGARGERTADEARAVVVEGLGRIADAGQEAGVPISLEPMTLRNRDEWTLISSVPEALELFAEVGREDLRLVPDVWHMFDVPDAMADLRGHFDRIATVQLNDYRVPQSRNDRSMPGDGIAEVPALVATLETAGYRGWYDVEVFSDQLWQLPPDEFVGLAATAARRTFADAEALGV